MSRVSRRVQRLVGRTNWFWKSPKEKEDPFGRKRKLPPGAEASESKRAKLKSVIFIPHTPESLLKKQMQKAEDSLMQGQRFGRVRVVERGGTPLRI